MISNREREALATLASFCTGAYIAIGIAVLVGLQQHLDAADDEAARRHAARQAQVEAKVGAWEHLENKACKLDDCDRAEAQ